MKKNQVFLLPSTGENYGHAILDAMGSGLPVLISDRTPWRDLEHKRAGLDLDLSNEEEWLNSLQFFIDMDESAYLEWSRAAREYAISVTEDKSVLEQNRRLFA